MTVAEKEGGIGAHDRLLGRTEEDGRQEVGSVRSRPRRCSTRPWTPVDPSPSTVIPTGIRLTEPPGRNEGDFGDRVRRLPHVLPARRGPCADATPCRRGRRFRADRPVRPAAVGPVLESPDRGTPGSRPGSFPAAARSPSRRRTKPPSPTPSAISATPAPTSNAQLLPQIAARQLDSRLAGGRGE